MIALFYNYADPDGYPSRNFMGGYLTMWKTSLRNIGVKSGATPTTAATTMTPGV